MPTARAARYTSVVNSPHEPAFEKRVVIKTVQPAIRLALFAVARRRVKMNLQIPFLLLPRIVPPPVARCAPRPRSRQHFSAQPFENYAKGISRMQLEPYGNRRTECSKTRRSHWLLILLLWLFF